MLRDKRPDMRIFFDFDEIKAGVHIASYSFYYCSNVIFIALVTHASVLLICLGFQWQQTLYHSIDCARCFLVLCSKPYLESLVCQEEFSIALAKLTQKVDFVVVVECGDRIGCRT